MDEEELTSDEWFEIGWWCWWRRVGEVGRERWSERVREASAVLSAYPAPTPPSHPFLIALAVPMFPLSVGVSPVDEAELRHLRGRE